MTDTHSDQTVQGDRLAQLARRAHDVANASVSAVLHGDGRRRLLMTAFDEAPGRRALFGLFGKGFVWTSFASLAAAGAIALLLAWPFGARPLTYEIRGGQRVAANYVDALRDAPASVEFSDGSKIVASAGSRLRIDATNEHGARVFVERGSATAQVTHRAHSSWVFIAGPFDVHITGTRFTLAWDPREQAIDLTLHQGSVSVDSPLGSTHCVLRAGQRFRASLASGTMQLDNGQSEALPATSSASVAPTNTNVQGKSKHVAAWSLRSHTQAYNAAASTSAGGKALGAKAADQSASDGALERASNAGALASGKSLDARKHGEVNEHADASQQAAARKPTDARTSDWPSLVRHGEFNTVVDAATLRGVDLTLRTASAADVRALADASRYTGHAALAERSLTALRERFAGTRQSAAAAFLLGRTLESSGNVREADRFYALYLTESADGEFAAEALAGHMRAVAALQGPAAAKPVALEYLRRYRAGVHAETARRLANGN
jgi:hypothetical protein